MIFLAVKLLVGVFILLINVKMPTITIVGILKFISRINFVLSRVEQEKSFTTPEIRYSYEEAHL